MKMLVILFFSSLRKYIRNIRTFEIFIVNQIIKYDVNYYVFHQTLLQVEYR